MKVRIKSKNKLNYETKGACGFDFKSSKEYTIKPGEMVMLETDTSIETPEGYMLMLAPRSSTYKKLGLILVNSVGIIDNDYCGDNDTIKFQYLNLGANTININEGDRIGQGVFIKVGKAEFEYVDSMNNEDRGGIGTTGL